MARRRVATACSKPCTTSSRTTAPNEDLRAMIDRSTALQRTLAAAAAFSIARPSIASVRRRPDVPMYHEWKAVRDKHVLVAAGVSGNMVLILGKDNGGGILVDTQTAPFGGQI